MADRLSWLRFCRLGPSDAVPDANTLSDFREALIAAVIERPAERLGARFENPAAIEMIAKATAREPGALPMLSYLLEDTWGAMQADAVADGRLERGDLSPADRDFIEASIARGEAEQARVECGGGATASLPPLRWCSLLCPQALQAGNGRRRSARRPRKRRRWRR